MTISFTNPSSASGGEPIDLLIPLAFEYLSELARLKLVELTEVPAKNGTPLLLVVIPNAKVEDNKIVRVVPTWEKKDEK